MVFASAVFALAAASAPATAPASTPHVIFGTGFFYNRQGDFFTNRHVVANCRLGTIEARTFDGTWHDVTLLALGQKADIAAGTVGKEMDAFASIRVFGNSTSVSVPEPTEDIFSAGYSAPARNRFKLQTKWGQIQPWSDPNARPFIQRMRMDAFPGASGSPILDYAGLLVGILFAGSTHSAPDLDNLRAAGYGHKWIFFYNNNAIVEFANANKLNYSSWGSWKRQTPTFIANHARQITVLIACESEDGA
jgi:S1-C subfamily serine protease